MSGSGGGDPQPPGTTFDVGPVYELGSAWSVMGDALNAHMALLSDALTGVTWDGPAQVQFMALYEQVQKILQNLPEAAWQTGAAINAYGDQAVASEQRYAAEQHAS